MDNQEKTFKDLKDGDILWVFRKIKSYVNIAEDMFEHNQLSNLIREINKIGDDNSNEDFPCILALRIIKVKYPGIIEHGYNYMKMCDGHPSGVGTTYVKEEDDNIVDITVINEYDKQETISIRGANNCRYTSYEYENFFIYEDHVKKHANVYYETLIEKFNNEKKTIDEKILKINELIEITNKNYGG